MKRKVHITRNDTGLTRYSGKALNIWFDSDSSGSPGYRLVNGKSITVMSVNEKEHYLVFQRPGLLSGDLIRYTVPKGTDNLELTVSVDAHGKISVRKKPGKKADNGSRTTAKSTRNLHVVRGAAEGYLPETPIRMAVDYMSKKPVIYEFQPNMEYTITTDRKKHELAFFYPDVQKGDIVLRTLEAGSRDEAFYVDFDEKGVLTAVKTDLPKNTAAAGKGKASGKKSGIASDSAGTAVKKSSSGKKTTTPDLENSLTLIALNYEFMDFFDQDSQFAADLDKAAKTCFLSVEEDRVRVTIMTEDPVKAQTLPDGGTQVVEFVYSKLDTGRQMEVLDITQTQLENQFDRLSREEDRQILMEKLLNVISSMPHLIVEGNSFRSRRRGEELIDVVHCLTTAALKHKIMKMFAPDREFTDVLRYSNVEYCFVAAYSRCISFIYLDKDDETVEKFTYDFDELVGRELLEGEDCFGELKSEPEQVLLSELIGQGLADLPHLIVEYDTMVRVNTDMLPKKTAVYVKKGAPDTPDFPAKSALADSPTTVALVTQLTEYFKEGSMFDQMLKTGMYDQITFNAGGSDAALGFLKKTEDGSLNVCGNMALDYAYFGTGQEGSFTELDMDQQDELEEIVWSEFPFLRN